MSAVTSVIENRRTNLQCEQHYIKHPHGVRGNEPPAFRGPLVFDQMGWVVVGGEHDEDEEDVPRHCP